MLINRQSLIRNKFSAILVNRDRVIIKTQLFNSFFLGNKKIIVSIYHFISWFSSKNHSGCIRVIISIFSSIVDQDNRAFFNSFIISTPCIVMGNGRVFINRNNWVKRQV